MDLSLTNYTAAIWSDTTTNAPSAHVRAVQVANPQQWSNKSTAAFVQALQNQALQAGRPEKDRQDLAVADFFSLYAVTQKVCGSDDALADHITSSTDTDTVLNPLFGDGTQTGGVIDGVIIGGTTTKQNTYPDIRYSLVQLGFEGSIKADGTSANVQYPIPSNNKPTLANAGPHFHHFHIYLQPPTPVLLGPTQYLQVAEASSVTPTTKTQSSDTATGILTPELVRKIENKVNEEISVCVPPSGTSEPLNDNDAVLQNFVPAAWIRGILERDYQIKLPAGTIIPTRLTHPPQYGKLVVIDNRYSLGTGDAYTEVYEYTPDLAYYKAHGVYQDTAKFEVDINGDTFHLNYTIEVSPYPCGVGQAGDINQDGMLNAAVGPVIRMTLERVTSQAQECAAADAVLAQMTA